MHDLSKEENPNLVLSESQKIRPTVRFVDHPIEVGEELRPYSSKHNIEIFDLQNNLIGKMILRKKLASDKPDHPRPRVALIEEIILE